MIKSIGFFLEDTMIGRGFDKTWIKWVMSSVQGGKVSINVNGLWVSTFLLIEA